MGCVEGKIKEAKFVAETKGIRRRVIDRKGRNGLDKKKSQKKKKKKSGDKELEQKESERPFFLLRHFPFSSTVVVSTLFFCAKKYFYIEYTTVHSDTQLDNLANPQDETRQDETRHAIGFFILPFFINILL